MSNCPADEHALVAVVLDGGGSADYIFNEISPMYWNAISPLYLNAIMSNQLNIISRKKLFEFYEAVGKNRKIAEEDITNANYEFLEFERLSQQGTNDSYSIRQRVKIISDFIGIKE